MKKRLYISAGTLVACIGIVLAMLPPRSGVTKANFDRIKTGMMMAEVVEIFGRAGGHFDGFVGKPAYYWENEDRSYAIIIFDNDMQFVEKTQWGDSLETIGDKIRRLMRRPWW